MAASVKFSSKMDPKVLGQLRAHAESGGRTLAAVLEEAASEYLERGRVRPAFQKAAERVQGRNAALLARLAK